MRDLQGGELLVEGGLVSFELRGVVLGCLAAGRAALLFLLRAVPHRLESSSGGLELAAWRASPSPRRKDKRERRSALAWRRRRAEARLCRGTLGWDGMGWDGAPGRVRLESSTTDEWARPASSVRRRDFWVVLITSDRKRGGGCATVQTVVGDRR